MITLLSSRYFCQSLFETFSRNRYKNVLNCAEAHTRKLQITQLIDQSLTQVADMGSQKDYVKCFITPK